MPKKSTKNTSQKPLPSEMFPELTEQSSERSASLLLDFRARIFQLLENEKGWKVLEAAFSIKRHALSESADPIYLSLRMSKDSFPPMGEGTLNESCERLPTLGFMSANGNLLILPGYYPKIESGYTLSDILQDPNEVDEKYFLSQKVVEKLMEYNERQKKNNRGFRAEFTEGGEVKQALKVGGGRKGRLNQVGQLKTKYESSSRVYSPEGNSAQLTAQGGGWGAKTGLYEVSPCIRAEHHNTANVHFIEVKNDNPQPTTKKPE